MSIRYLAEKIKPFRGFLREKILIAKDNFKVSEDIFLVVLIILVGLISFGLGKLSAMEKGSEMGQTASIADVSSDDNAQTQAQASTISPKPIIQDGTVVASKNGTKYYLPTCSGASRIKDENKIWFKSIAEAQAAGLTAAANCPGLQ